MGCVGGDEFVVFYNLSPHITTLVFPIQAGRVFVGRTSQFRNCKSNNYRAPQGLWTSAGPQINTLESQVPSCGPEDHPSLIWFWLTPVQTADIPSVFGKVVQTYCIQSPAVCFISVFFFKKNISWNIGWILMKYSENI